jgi:hypothetical protein
VWGPTARDGRQGICEWYFSLAPTAEGDVVNDYEAQWVQIDVDPPTGSCVQGVDLSYDFDGAQIVSATRNGSARYRSTRRVTETLEVDAGGQASTAASVFTKTLARPGSVHVQLKDNALRYAWRGRAAASVSLVLGLQLRVSPTQPIYTVLSTKSVVVGPC